MLLLNTRFAVSQDLDRKTFMNMFRLWVQSSTYAACEIPDDVLDQADYVTEAGDEENKRKISVCSLDDLLGVVVESKDKGNNWKLSYAFYDKEQVPFITVFLDKTGGMRFDKDDSFNLPGFLKQIFWNEYGGDDEGLLTDNRAVILRKAQIPEFKKDKFLFKARMNPVVYVSCNKDGSYKIDYDSLAVELMGQAHVIVEGSPAVAGLVTDFWKKKPSNGDCTIILPTGDTQDVALDSGSHSVIVSTVRDCLNRGVSYVFDPVSYRTQSLSSKLALEDKELADMFDEILGQKDSEITGLKAEIERLKEVAHKASSKASALQGSIENSVEASANAFSFEGDEKDIYPDERKDIILKVLQKEYDSISHDANTSKSRKADVLKDVLEHNPFSGTDAELIDAIKGAFDGGTLTKNGIGRLQSLGFGVKTEKNNHIRVTYGNDPRYAVVIASTASDHRAGLNCISDFTGVCFR